MWFTLFEWIVILCSIRFLYFVVRTSMASFISKSLSTVNPIDLRKKYGTWAVVTGATDGIGKAYAIQLAKRNMNLVLISRNIAKLNTTAQYIQSLHTVDIQVIQADFSEGKSVYDDIGKQLRDLDIGILVNNVGMVSSDPICRSFDSTHEDQVWNEIIINCGATAMMTKLVLPGMKQKRRGIIVNMGSLSSQRPHPYLSNYAATKAYMQHFSKSIEAEVQKFNIQVQHLYPGLINTNMTKDNALTSKYIPSSLNYILYPNATLYAKWAICSLGIFRSTTGYWVFDFLHLVEQLEPERMYTYTFTKLVEDSCDQQLLN